MSHGIRRSRRHGSLPEVGEINVMPLVDLLLQLFIAVIIFFPVVEYGMNINLPKGTTDRIKQEQTRTISIDKQGHVLLNDTALPPQQFQAELAKIARVDPPITVLIKADVQNNYGAVMSVLTQLHAARITRIALMTQEANTASRAETSDSLWARR